MKKTRGSRYRYKTDFNTELNSLKLFQPSEMKASDVKAFSFIKRNVTNIAETNGE